jgi:hypothetical protein
MTILTEKCGKSIEYSVGLNYRVSSWRNNATQQTVK